LDLTFSRFNTCPQVVQRDVFAVHFNASAEDEAVNFIAFVPYEGEGNVGPTVRRGGVLFPLGATKFEDVVIYIQRERNVKVVGSYGWVWALGFGCFEIQEANLIPKKRSDMSL
jgi:hypothetical protein